MRLLVSMSASMNPNRMINCSQLVEPGMSLSCQKLCKPARKPICFLYRVATMAAARMVSPSRSIQYRETFRGFLSHSAAGDRSQSNGGDWSLINDLSQRCDEDIEKGLSPCSAV